MTKTYTKKVGPNAAANTDSGWLRLDEYAAAPVTFQTSVVGSVVYSVLTTNDDPNSLINPVASPVWDSTLTGVVGATANAYGVLEAIPAYIKINLASGTGSVSMTVTQASE
jgi:hypothetical protein